MSMASIAEYYGVIWCIRHAGMLHVVSQLQLPVGLSIREVREDNHEEGVLFRLIFAATYPLKLPESFSSIQEIEAWIKEQRSRGASISDRLQF